MMLNKRFFALAVVVALIVGVSATAAGADIEPIVLFDGGSPGGGLGLRVSDVEGSFAAAADDFSVVDDIDVTRAQFWTTEFPGMFDWSGVVNYFVFENVNVGGDNLPASVPIVSGQGTSVIKESDPAAGGWADGYRYTFDFDPPLDLEPATTYWLAINLPASSGLAESYWESTNSDFQNDALQTSSASFAWWNSYWFDLAFRLLHVPVPEPGPAAGSRVVNDYGYVAFERETGCDFEELWTGLNQLTTAGLKPGGQPSEPVAHVWASYRAIDTCTGEELTRAYGETYLSGNDFNVDPMDLVAFTAEIELFADGPFEGGPPFLFDTADPSGTSSGR